MNTDAESVPGALVNQSRKSVAPAKKKEVGAKQKAARAAKITKDPQRPPRSSRAASKTEKLVCRYCGSDDFAPSFKERRDARCRACFKKRYGSVPQVKKTAHIEGQAPRRSRGIELLRYPRTTSQPSPCAYARPSDCVRPNRSAA